MSAHIEDTMQTKCLKNYVTSGAELMFARHYLNHDGFDIYGPQSNLHDYLVIIKQDNRVLYDVFHREYWFNGDDDEEYVPMNKNGAFQNELYGFYDNLDKICHSQDIIFTLQKIKTF